MVFVLADVKPPLAGRTGCRGALFKYRAHADVHPVARQSSGLRCRLAHAGHEHGHTVVIQHGLESVDITFVDDALRGTTTWSVIWHPPKASHVDAGVGSPEPGWDDETADAVLLIDAPWFVIIIEARCIESSAVTVRCDQHH